MRLIGIQALLALLPKRIEAVASATGIGGGIGTGTFVGTASSTAQAAGVGSANIVDVALNTAAANAAATGGAVAVAAGGGAAIAQASGIGAFNIVATALNTASASASGTGAAAASSDPAADFLARTSGLDSTHTTAYTTLIDGLITDGVWDLLDALYIFATQDSTTALLNLVSSRFTAIAHGSPAFQADRGFTGVDNSTTVYIDSQFNPTTAASPHFTTNSCHISAWADTNVTSSSGGGVLIGVSNSNPNINNSSCYGRYSDGKAYFRINDASASAGATSASSVGHWLASRTGASASVGYHNGSSFATPNATAGTLENRSIYILNDNPLPGGALGSAAQVTMASMGSGLNSTQISNFYSRLRTYMTAVGVP